LPALGIENPGHHLKRRTVAHVPLMAARKLGHPVAELVLVVADDLASHAT
jgi:hypothetical protein